MKIEEAVNEEVAIAFFGTLIDLGIPQEIGEKEGQYFVDQATGQYYFQTTDGETMTVVSAPGIEEQGYLINITVSISYTNLNDEEAQPSAESGLWDGSVDTYADLTYIDTRDLSGTVNYLVKADEQRLHDEEECG